MEGEGRRGERGGGGFSAPRPRIHAPPRPPLAPRRPAPPTHARSQHPCAPPLATHPPTHPHTCTLARRYNSRGAEFYRDKIRAEVDGRSYTPPPPSAETRMAARPKSYAGSKQDNW